MAAEAGGDGAAQQQGGVWGPIARMAIMYFAVQAFVGRRSPSPPPPGPEQPLMMDDPSVTAGSATLEAARTASSKGVAPTPTPAVPLTNAWPPRQSMDLRVYVTESPEFSSFGDTSALIWQEYALGYGRDEAMRSASDVSSGPRPPPASSARRQRAHRSPHHISHRSRHCSLHLHRDRSFEPVLL